MTDLGWDLPAARTNGAGAFEYDPYAPAPAQAATPTYYAKPALVPAPTVPEQLLAPARVEPEATPEAAPAAPAVALDPMATLLPAVAMPLTFVALRLGLTPLLGLTSLALPWLAVGAMAMVVLALVLTRLLGRDALWLGLLLAVLAAIAETLLLVAPVALLSAVVAARLTGSR